MAAPSIAHPPGNLHRLFLAEAFADLRPDLAPEIIDGFVERAIQAVLSCPPGELPADAFLP